MTSLRSILISLIVFSMAIAGMGMIVADFNTSYNVTIDTGWEDTYNLLDNVTENTGVIKNQTAGSEIETATAFESLSQGGLASLKLFYNSGAYFSSIINNMALEYGVPAWVVEGLLAIIILTISMIILSAIFRFFV